MKNIYYILLVVSLFAVTSCQKEFNSVFDKTPAEREALEKKKWVDILTSAPNGWLMHYYPNPELLGGFSFAMKFNEKEEVGMNWSIRDEYTTSLYSVKIMEKPLLSFDTYSLISKMADPAFGIPGVGFGGDNEFAILSQSPDGDTLYLQERNKKDPLVMVKAQPQVWEQIKQYPQQETILKRRGNEVVPYYYNLHVKGWESGITMSYYPDMQRVNLCFNEKGRDSVLVMGINLTHEGFEFRVPLVRNGIAVKSFRYLPDENRHVVAKDPALGGFSYENKCMAKVPGMHKKFVDWGNFGEDFAYSSPLARQVFTVKDDMKLDALAYSAFSPTFASEVKLHFGDYTSVVTMNVKEYLKLSENEFRIVFKEYADEESRAIMETEKGRQAMDFLFCEEGWTIVPVFVQEYGSQCYWVSNKDPRIYFSGEK